MNQQAIVDRPDGEERAARARIDAAAKLLRGGKSDVPDDFVALLFGRAAPEDLVGYEAAELAALAREAWAFLATRKPGAPKIRFEQPAASGGEHLKSISVIEIVNDDMPFLVDSVMAELTERGLARAGRPSDPRGRARGKTGKLAGPPRARPAQQGETRESFIHIHVERIDDAARAAPRSCRRWSRCWPRSGAACRTGGRWSAASTRSSRSSRPIRRRCRSTTSPRRSSSSNGWLADNFTLLGVRDYTLTGKERDLKPVLETGLGVLRGGDVPVLTRGGQVVSITPQLRAFFDEPKTLIVTKANAKSRVHRRVYLDYIGVKRFDADGNPTGEFRIVGLFTSTAYIRSTRSIPYLRRKVDAVLTRAGFDPGQTIPARRWSTCWRPIRATSCSRSTRTRSIISRWASCSSTSGRGCACWRAATASTASSRCWSMCRASATAARCARRSANISPRSSRATSAPTIRTFTMRR